MLKLSEGEFSDIDEREKLVRDAVAKRGANGAPVVSVDAEIGSHAVMLDGLSEEVDPKTGNRKTFAHVRDPL